MRIQDKKFGSVHFSSLRRLIWPTGGVLSLANLIQTWKWLKLNIFSKRGITAWKQSLFPSFSCIVYFRKCTTLITAFILERGPGCLDKWRTARNWSHWLLVWDNAPRLFVCLTHLRRIPLMQSNPAESSAHLRVLYLPEFGDQPCSQQQWNQSNFRHQLDLTWWISPTSQNYQAKVPKLTPRF